MATLLVAESLPHGAMSQVSYGSGGIVESVLFNSRLQPTEIGAKHSGNSILTLGYTYGAANNNNGNILAHTFTSDATRTQTFTYDALNRLKSATEAGGWLQTYAYDRYGNRAVLSGSWTPIPNDTPTVADQLPSTVEAQFPSNRWAAGLTFDNGIAGGPGLVTTSGTRTYTYDGENRLKTAMSGGLTSTYDYDGDGRRVKKVDGYGTTQYVYDAQGQLAVENFAPNGTTQPAQAESGTRYLIRDHLGSTRATTDAAATSVRYFDYLPFGEDIAQGNNGRGAGYATGISLTVPGNVTERFTGKERDAETGLDYFGARYFSGAQGRWTSPDAINLTRTRLVNPSNTLNKYVYGANNPLKYLDRDGNDITIFYRGGLKAGRGLDTGHIFIGALNQDTGKVKFLDFYPKGPVPGPGVINQGMTLERLRNHASLTIQTSPEVAQKVINAIEKLEKNPPQYDLHGVVCTTLCETVLNEVGLSGTGLISPDDVWSMAFYSYSDFMLSNPAYRTASRIHPFSLYRPGQEFGRPRFGDQVGLMFQLYQQQRSNAPTPKGCVELVDSASGTRSKQCE